ncbi:MAG: CPBP family intramembrane glutamic endopeptidase [Promethearchaeota archaeon]
MTFKSRNFLENTKNIFIIVSVIVLIIPILLGLNITYIFISVKIDYLEVIFLILGTFLLLALGLVFLYFSLNEKVMKEFQKHPLVNALITKKNILFNLFIFSMTMIMEELIFRLYLIAFFLDILKLLFVVAILMDGVIFSLYHLHFLTRFKNARIIWIYLIFSFFLGTFNSYILVKFGLISCILIHFSIALLIYIMISKKYVRN